MDDFNINTSEILDKLKSNVEFITRHETLEFVLEDIKRMIEKEPSMGRRLGMMDAMGVIIDAMVKNSRPRGKS